jgi:hypothetical protein
VRVEGLEGIASGGLRAEHSKVARSEVRHEGRTKQRKEVEGLAV